MREASAPLTSEEALQLAEAEGLTLLKAKNKAGYFGVSLNNPGLSRPYAALVQRDGKQEHLGGFATAEEAALCIARTPEGRAAAAKRAASAPPPRPDPAAIEVAAQEAAEATEAEAAETAAAAGAEAEVADAAAAAEKVRRRLITDSLGRPV